MSTVDIDIDRYRPLSTVIDRSRLAALVCSTRWAATGDLRYRTDSDTETETETDTQRQRHRDRETERQRARDTETETDTQTHRHTHVQRWTLGSDKQGFGHLMMVTGYN